MCGAPHRRFTRKPAKKATSTTSRAQSAACSIFIAHTDAAAQFFFSSSRRDLRFGPDITHDEAFSSVLGSSKTMA